MFCRSIPLNILGFVAKNTHNLLIIVYVKENKLAGFDAINVANV